MTEIIPAPLTTAKLFSSFSSILQIDILFIVIALSTVNWPEVH
jgi:hypothetical protein